MPRREIQEINAGSMADIAFLLLIFFLVTTTMDTDSGILKRLSPVLPEEQDPPEVRERNIFVVLVNRNDQLHVEGELMNISKLKANAREFILNPDNRDDLPEKTLKSVPPFGDIEVCKGVISLKTDRGTSFKMFITVMNELMAALKEIKDESAMKYFGKKYNELEKQQKDIIDDIIPVVISEAEPNKI